MTIYCITCGADNLERAKYCRKCGESLEKEDETRVAVRGETAMRSDDKPVEKKIFETGPTLLFVKMGYALAAIGALFLAAFTSVFLATWISVWFSVFIGLLLFLIPAYFHLTKKMVNYTLSETKLEIDEGLIARRTRSIPLRRVQDVTVSATAAQRILRLGDVTIDNASEDAEKVVLKNVNDPRERAEDILRQMRRLGS